MKRRGLLHPEINDALARLGHTDWLVVADCGLPIPPGVRRIDLALVPGVPSFVDVVRALADELAVEKLVVAREMREHNPRCLDALTRLFPGVPVEEVPHEAFKARVASARAVIRTGEATPYANVILQAGVIF